PACAGMPGMPPVTNKKAVELGIAAGLVTNSEISPVITFDKKNYFYPDLPAGYQITQWFAPICKNGWVDIEYCPEGGGESVQKRIRLKQIHIEEDAGKLVHDPRTDTSLVDFNRTSVPLTEIVSLPDFRCAEEVIAYLEKLRALLTFAGVSDCKMQEGSMRCDVNLSVRPVGSETLGVRTEMKNMNSLRAIARAIAYESARHIEALETGREQLVQETRRWDDDRNMSFAMREKETAADYRYFPNPELMPIDITTEWIERVRAGLPEPADVKYKRLTGELGLPEYDARLITGSANLSAIFDAAMARFPKAKEVANWILTELLSIAKGDNKGEDDIAIDGGKFAAVMKLVDDKTVNRTVGKKLLAKVLEEDIDPAAYVAAHNLGMVSDEGSIEAAVREVLAENPDSVAEYKAGNQKVIAFFVGRIMRKTGGKADPASVNELLIKLLNI
ncbi:MAG: Asp-tRNA(Asn)/Glu-tRNA(Gln) amidotransferase subunit GatB, partial [Oscillospiraceae bacterium]|nr:Asp-tRNA(Asn)/Glu-tRNA(Gln) amidotransferase subunit GatB [Oscillospiraceae bacterium]